MALTAPAKPAASGLTARDFYALLDLLASPDEARRVLKEIRDAEASLRTAQSEARAEQTQLMESERAQAERQKGLDADWVRLKQAQADLDDAKATFAADKAKDVKEIESRYLANRARTEELDKREAGLNGRASDLAKQADELNQWKEGWQDAQANAAAKLDAREAAVAAREQAADAVAALIAKARG